MADDPKPNPDPATQKPSEQPPSAASISPAVTDVTDVKTGDGKAAGDQAEGKIQAEALSDGTVPTVLRRGETHLSVPKGKSSLTSIYRRADIMTTLFTALGAVVAAAVVTGGYYFVTKNNAKPAPAPKVTTLDKSDLDKLGAFFQGNTAGNSSEVLTISSSSLFKNRVAVSSDLKVTGGLEVTGSSQLGDLTVNKTSTLGVTNVRGQLTVDGPLTVQSPALFNSGGSFKGNLSATGNGSFGGSVSAGAITVTNLSVTGTLNLNGHVNIGGSNSTAAPASSFTESASVSGTDSSGTVTITIKPTGPLSGGANLVTVNFRTNYPVAPTVVITPVGRGAAVLQPYVTASANSFTVGAATIAGNGNATSYSFNYWVAQ